ncbi:prenylcysteine oxidase 1 [Patella vulgata]|uniref:prenylcysteine oxidase 1 n=1 Tax=Patella vulgata TaxID=6465 RepID=UPI00218091A3|nr:prenylcysteine oxidase 1 [Patella vulgata]
MWRYIVCILLIFSMAGPSIQDEEDDQEATRIGIIGGGISGTSTAYYLRKLFGDGVKIDLFESERVGGRLANINIDGVEYEAGGSILHPKNKYMVEFAKQFGYEQRTSTGGRMALYGNSGVIIESCSWNLVTMAKFFWRYGFDVSNIETFLKETFFDKFDRIYNLQDEGLAFTTVEELLRAMDESFVNFTKITLQTLLEEKGYSERFINEIAMGALRTNYGQTTNVHAFVGAVSLAGVEKGLWAVKGGNFQIPERLLKKSKATLINAEVTQVILQKDSTDVSYEVNYKNTADGKTNSREYDIVVVAAPFRNSEKNKIEFVDFPTEIPSSITDFHRTLALFVQGTPNYTTYGFNSADDFPESVLTTNESIFWNSYGKQSSVSGKKHLEKKTDPTEDDIVSKIFLNKVPTEEQVRLLFQTRKELRLVDWLAYPEYKPNMELPAFVLYDQLYYVNAIESAASAVEMDVIGARNVANLAYNHWNNIFDKVDEINIKSEPKKEEL